MSNDRFSNTFGKEFDLCTVGIPHYNYFHNELVQILEDRFSTKNSIRILEIGAGTGNLLQRLNKSNLKFDYIGVESSPIMFNQLKNKFSNSINAKFVLKDGLQYLRDNKSHKFSVVINSWTFHNWNYKYRQEAIKGVFYNLDENGIFLNADKIASNCPFKHKRYYNWQINYIKKVFSERPDIINEWVHHYKVDEKKNIVLKEIIFSKTLEKIGFSKYEAIKRKYMDVIYIACK